MTGYPYASQFSNRIQDFIAQKNAIGFPYQESARLLFIFDQFCKDQFPAEAELSKELCMAWAVKKEEEGVRTFANRLMPIREFARYLIRNGEPAFILPTNLVRKPPRYVPYIYSEAEISAIWNAADHLQPCQASPVRHLVFPMFLRLLYCCGLRPGEARKLHMANVDLKNGCLYIMESKGHKDRIVAMADDVTQRMRHYDKHVSEILPGRTLFFPAPSGEAYSRTAVAEVFHGLKERANVSCCGKSTPRLYDFRHTFATHRLYKWMKDGRDITACIPYLSAYMGHAQLSDTYYYIHLVPEIFEMMSGFDFSISSELLPEVSYDE